MIQIVAWLGVVFSLMAGVGMLFVKTPPEKRVQTRLLGLMFFGLAVFNYWLATRAP
ncbi:MAG: hypothetical protein AB7O91_07975 [Sphingomonas sp.]